MFGSRSAPGDAPRSVSVRSSARGRCPRVSAEHRVHGLPELGAAAVDLEAHRLAGVAGHVHAPRPDEVLRAVQPTRPRREILPDRLPVTLQLRLPLPVVHAEVDPPCVHRGDPMSLRRTGRTPWGQPPARRTRWYIRGCMRVSRCSALRLGISGVRELPSRAINVRPGSSGPLSTRRCPHPACHASGRSIP
jgi:hypothetical protein